MEDEDEVDVLGDFCLNLETDINHYDAGEFPTQSTELLGDYMQHPWLLDNSQVWYFDHSTDDKSKTTLEVMLQDERKHFASSSSVQSTSVISQALPISKVSPTWTKDDIDSLKKGIGLHGQNWSKVARIVGTKTTLQVKSYVKSHPDLVNATSQQSVSPPHYNNEVEVPANEETVSTTQFTIDDIVNEAEIPASIEEVIASSVNTKIPQKHSVKISRIKSPVKPQHNKLGKSSTRKKISNYLKKNSKKMTTSASAQLTITQQGKISKSVPVLEGEIIRIKKENKVSDSDSDSEVDICDDDNCAITNEREVSVNKLPQSDSIQSDFKDDFEEKIELPLQTVAESVEIESSPYNIFDCGNFLNPTESPQTESQPVFTFAAPVEENEIDLNVITDEEKTVHWDFFEGRSSKTPERYLKIRNSIVQEWRRVKPRYLTKTSVRPTLKNCGDVNCISRVHAYLELIGAINFGCEQVQYDRPLPPVPSHRERVVANNGAHSNNLSTMKFLARDRKKRQQAELAINKASEGGYTIRHDGSLVMSNGGGAVQSKIKQKRKCKSKAMDPFELVPCISFGGEKSAPFKVHLSAAALTIIDIHCHLCTTEVIGLLGGRFHAGTSDLPPTLVVEAAQPCRSLATGHQCEMCPISQTEGSEELRSRGLEIVGWYHSHPTFPALPSLRDLHTQNEFQQWFSRQDAPFVGIIVNPFSTASVKSPVTFKSIIRCITVHDELPYKHEMTITDQPNVEDIEKTLDVLARGLDLCPTLVPLDSPYPYSPVGTNDAVSYAKKIPFSLRCHLEEIVNPVTLKRIEDTVTDFLHRLDAVRADNLKL